MSGLICGLLPHLIEILWGVARVFWLLWRRTDELAGGGGGDEAFGKVEHFGRRGCAGLKTFRGGDSLKGGSIVVGGPQQLEPMPCGAPVSVVLRCGRLHSAANPSASWSVGSTVELHAVGREAAPLGRVNPALKFWKLGEHCQARLRSR